MPRSLLAPLAICVASARAAAGLPSAALTSTEASPSGVPPSNCTADEDCLSLGLRCLPSASGAPCVLDYGYNLTGVCACQPQPCENFTYSKADPDKRQWLVVGDSISMGYKAPLAAALHNYDVVHVGAAGKSLNCDNAYFASRCVAGWLGANASRWDVVSYNAGLHDLAFPDNEHLSIGSYATFLGATLKYLGDTLRPDATLLWMSTTPVPTNPPGNCTLIPGRVESQVAAYNAAAAAVVAAQARAVRVCDLHAVINDYCGEGYSVCNITQCAGPHFSDVGWELLARKAAQCA